MIHAKELRYGNQVQTRQGEVITVQQIHAGTLVYDCRLTLSRELVNAGGSHKTAYASTFVETIREASFQDILPIVLTPDLLEKCGFRNFVRDEWIMRMGNSHLDFSFTDEGLRLQNSSRISIRYLHQLQNFLYALGGYELKVDLMQPADRNNAN